MRDILHSDCDNFYASVECVKNPDYWKVPLVVAGSEESRHSVIVAKNQVAKEYGIKTGDVLWEARKKCPNLVVTKSQFGLYEEYSRKIKKIYTEFTNQVESFGLDECFLDVTGSKKLFGSGEEIAKKISERIYKDLGITVTIGVSFNKTFAKIASDIKKPNSINIITKENFKDILWPLPAKRLLYVGKASDKLLSSRGIYTIGDIANTNPEILKNILGKKGIEFYKNANGYDCVEVKDVNKTRETKSIGNGTTTARNLYTEKEVSKVFLMLSESVATRIRKNNLFANNIGINIKYSDFTSIDRQKTLSYYCHTAFTIHQVAMELYRKNATKGKPIRALSIRCTGLTENLESEQLSLLEDISSENKKRDIEKSMDKIRDKYGFKAISRASLLVNKESKDLDPTESSLNSVAFRIDK